MHLFKNALRLTNTRVRMAVGLGLLATICMQCARPTEAFRQDPMLSAAKVQADSGLEQLAAEDPVSLLKSCLANYDATVRDYTCLFIKQERINGVVGKEQHIQTKFKDRPFSVAMRWVKNAPIGDRCLYVKGQNNDMLLVRPKGMLASLVGTVQREPEGKEVMANTLRPVTMFGFRNGLTSLLEVYELAAQRGELTHEYQGVQELDGREVLVLERLLPARDEYPAWKTVIAIDRQWQVPVYVKGWNWDDEVTSEYRFSEVEFNVGLTDADFTPETNGL